MTQSVTTLDSLHYRMKRTAFGPIYVIWATTPDLRIKRILLPTYREVLRTEYPEAKPSTDKEIDYFSEDISRFLEGDDRHFNLQILDMNSCSPFQRRVLHAEHNIPRRWVSTYSRIAMHLGNVNGARAVGKALATNPFPLAIPCHRAVRSNGALGGYQGGEEMKRQLLKMEGVRFTASGRVLLDRVYY